MKSETTLRTSTQRRTLAAVVGTACCGILVSVVPKFEGVVLRGYKDPIGIVTACAGHTATAVLGRPYSKAECETLLQADLVDHLEGVLACTPQLKDHTGPLAAAGSFAFNVGVAKYCGSTMASKFRAYDFAGACAELKRWDKAGGKVLPGLTKRRASEYAICMGEQA